MKVPSSKFRVREAFFFFFFRARCGGLIIVAAGFVGGRWRASGTLSGSTLLKPRCPGAHRLDTTSKPGEFVPNDTAVYLTRAAATAQSCKASTANKNKASSARACRFAGAALPVALTGDRV